MLPVPAGTWSTTEYIAARMLATSAQFQATAGVASMAEAFALIGFGDWPDLDPQQRPACQAAVSIDQFGYRRTSAGSQDYLRAAGGVILYLQLDLPKSFSLDPEAGLSPTARRYATDWIGTVLEQLAAEAGKDQTADADVPESQLSLSAINVVEWNENPIEQWQSRGRFSWWIVQLQFGEEG